MTESDPSSTPDTTDRVPAPAWASAKKAAAKRPAGPPKTTSDAGDRSTEQSPAAEPTDPKPAEKGSAKKAAAQKDTPHKDAAKKAADSTPATSAPAKKAAADATPAKVPAKKKDAARTTPAAAGAATTGPAARKQRAGTAPAKQAPPKVSPGETPGSAAAAPAPSTAPSPDADVVAQNDAVRATFAQLRAGAPTELPSPSRLVPLVVAGAVGAAGAFAAVLRLTKPRFRKPSPRGRRSSR
ncbi:hypothetical protein GCM10009624_27220 [Gordonia sinesedis]